MKFCVFSDVHGNLPALETLLGATAGRVDGYICLGDIVNYAPWNDECLERIFALPNVSVIEGNHERLFLGPHPGCPQTQGSLVQEFLETSSKWFTRHDLLSNLPKSITVSDYLLVHTIGDLRIYPNSNVEPPGNFFIGHTHHQFRIDRPNGSIVNCGSVGQSRQNGSVIAYAVWDCDAQVITFYQLPYPVQRLLRELETRDYSSRCIQYYHQLINRGTL